MLFNQKTKSFLPVVTSVGGTMVTGDGVDLNEKYTLVWKLDGEEKTVTYEYDGFSLFKSAMAGLNFFVSEWGMDGGQWAPIRRETGTIASLWSTLTINPKKYKLAIKGYDKDMKLFLKKAKNGDKMKLEMVETFIATYLYIKMSSRDSDEEEYTTLVTNDFLSVSDAKMNLLANDADESWKNSPIAKELNLNSWDEYKATMSNGIMYGTFVPKLGEVTMN